MHDRQQQQDQKEEDFHRSLTTAEQEAKAMRDKSTALQHQLGLAIEQLNRFLELGSAFSAGISREFTCPNCHQQALTQNPSFGQNQYSTPTKMTNGQSMRRSSSGLDIDHDKGCGHDAPWTPVGQFQTWHMDDVSATNRQSSSIDEQSCQFTGRSSLTEETGPAFSFDPVAPLADIESNNPPLTLNHLAGDVWDTSPIKREGSTMQYQCYSTPRDARLGFAIDQRPEFPSSGFLAPVNEDHLHQRSFAFPPVSAATLCDFN